MNAPNLAYVFVTIPSIPADAVFHNATGLAVAQLCDLEHGGPRTDSEKRGDHSTGLNRLQTLQHAAWPSVAILHPLIEKARTVIFLPPDVNWYGDTLICKCFAARHTQPHQRHHRRAKLT